MCEVEGELVVAGGVLWGDEDVDSVCSGVVVDGHLECDVCQLPKQVIVLDDGVGSDWLGIHLTNFGSSCRGEGTITIDGESSSDGQVFAVADFDRVDKQVQKVGVSGKCNGAESYDQVVAHRC